LPKVDLCLWSIFRVGSPAETRPSGLSGSTLRLTDGVQGVVATPDGGDDLIWIGGPSEGPWIVVGLGEKAVDGGLEVDDRLEHAAFEPSFGELGEEALDESSSRSSNRIGM
jgi:hypothetical protein